MRRFAESTQIRNAVIKIERSELITKVEYVYGIYDEYVKSIILSSYDKIMMESRDDIINDS